MIVTFVIAWIVINWKFFLILTLGDADIIKRIEELEKLTSIKSMAIKPIAYSIAYISIIPYLSYYLHVFYSSISSSKKLIEKKNEIRNDQEVEVIKKQYEIKIKETEDQYKRDLENQKRSEEILAKQHSSKLEELENERNLLAKKNAMEHEKFKKEQEEQEAEHRLKMQENEIRQRELELKFKKLEEQTRQNQQ